MIFFLLALQNIYFDPKCFSLIFLFDIANNENTVIHEHLFSRTENSVLALPQTSDA